MTVYGTSIGGKSGSLTLTAEQTRFGTLPCVRQFFPGMPGAVPAGLTTSQVWCPSFKCSATDYTGLAAGTYTTALVTWLRSLPAGQPVLACYYHEPENDGFTFAQWKAAAGFWNNLVHTTSGIVANVQATQIYMEGTILGWNSRNINNYWDSTWDANHSPDHLGFDFDGPIVTVGGTTYPDISSWVTKTQAFATSKGIPWSVTEYGGDPLTSDTTHAGRTAWNNTNAQLFASGGAQNVMYWDDGNPYLSQTNEINAWKALIAQTPPTKPAPPTGVTASPAADGLTAVAGWATLPAGVDHLDAYLQGPGQTYPHKINTGGPIPISPRTYSFPTVPGTTYDPGVTLVASADPAGTIRSGFSSFAVVVAPNPGPAGHPVIVGPTATPDATNPLLVHVTASATGTSPFTYQWTFTYPADSSVSPVPLTAASGDVTLPQAGVWNWTLIVTDRNGLTTPQTGSVSISTTPANSTPFLNLRMLQHQEDSRQMAFIDQDAKPKVDAAIQALFARQSPQNAKYGLAGSNFSADQIAAGTTIAAASGVLMWWAFTLDASSLSKLLFATSVAQNGSGALVGVHDLSGGLLPDFSGAPASGTTVDAGFATTAGYGITVPLGLVVRRGVTWGQTLFGQVFWPAGMSTYPTFLCDAVAGAAARIGQGATTPLWGRLTGQSAYANDLSVGGGPWASWTAVNQAWVGAL